MSRFYRKRPLEVEAIQWTGDNLDELRAFTNGLFNVTTTSSVYTAKVYDALHGIWIPLVTGDWIIRGVKGDRGVQGELHPCIAAVFEAAYEPIPTSDN